MDQTYEVDGMKEPKVSVAWECRQCGKRHLWRWNDYDIYPDEKIFMSCGHRCMDTPGKLVRIGERSYALSWPEISA